MNTNIEIQRYKDAISEDPSVVFLDNEAIKIWSNQVGVVCRVEHEGIPITVSISYEQIRKAQIKLDSNIFPINTTPITCDN